jgi:hypothetical protein
MFINLFLRIDENLTLFGSRQESFMKIQWDDILGMAPVPRFTGQLKMEIRFFSDSLDLHRKMSHPICLQTSTDIPWQVQCFLWSFRGTVGPGRSHLKIENDWPSTRTAKYLWWSLLGPVSAFFIKYRAFAKTRLWGKTTR